MLLVEEIVLMVKVKVEEIAFMLLEIVLMVVVMVEMMVEVIVLLVEEIVHMVVEKMITMLSFDFTNFTIFYLSFRKQNVNQLNFKAALTA